MKTDLILKFKQTLFSKVIWSSTFKPLSWQEHPTVNTDTRWFYTRSHHRTALSYDFLFCFVCFKYSHIFISVDHFAVGMTKWYSLTDKLWFSIFPKLAQEPAVCQQLLLKCTVESILNLNLILIFKHNRFFEVNCLIIMRALWEWYLILQYKPRRS